jgi:hypothetical protein
MLLAGYGNDLLYRTTRDGVLNSSTVQPVPGALFESVTFENSDGESIVYLLVKATPQVYLYNLKTNTLVGNFTPAGVTNPSAIFWDSGTPNEFYIIGNYSGAAGALRIVKLKKSDGTLGTAPNTWALPAGLTSPAGMAMDPATGAFYVVQNVVNGAGATRSIDIYRIDRAAPTTADIISVNIADAGSTATSATTNYFGLAYELETNRLFISDLFSNMVYEVIPPRMLTLNQ